jgi:hypothetical protein
MAIGKPIDLRDRNREFKAFAYFDLLNDPGGELSEIKNNGPHKDLSHAGAFDE